MIDRVRIQVLCVCVEIYSEGIRVSVIIAKIPGVWKLELIASYAN